MQSGVADDEGLLDELLAYLQQDEDIGQSPSVRSAGQYDVGTASGEQTALLGTQGPQARTDRRPSGSRLTSGATTSATRGKRQRDVDKVKELEALAAEKMAQFAALAQRNAELKYKSRILSEAVTIRDYQLQLARGGGHQYPERLPVAPSAPEAAASAPAGSLAAARTVAEVVRTPGSVRLLLSPELLPDMDSDSVKSITKSELMTRYKAFLTEVSSLLLALGDDSDNEQAALRLRNVTAETGCLLRMTSVLAPDTMLAFQQTHLETGALAAPEPGHWVSVLETMELAEDQLRDVRTVYGLYSSIMRGVLTERQTIQAELSRGLQTHPATPLAAQLTMPAEGEVLPTLERNLRKEAGAHLLLRAFLFGRVLSVVQMGRATVHSYPFFPNATGLAAAAAGVIA